MELQTPNLEHALTQFSPADATIAEMQANFMSMVVNGLDDKEGIKAVHDARMIVKGHRVQVEKTRVALKKDALEYGRAVDAEAKRITALLTPIEDHLAEQESIVAKEKARKEAERQAKLKARLDARMAKLTAVSSPLLPSDVEPMSNDQFEAALADATKANEIRMEAERQEAEAKRQAEEKAAREAEAERQRMAEERAELERKQAELRAQQEAEEAKRRAEQEKLDAERRKIEAERAEIQRQKELEEAKARAIEEEKARAAKAQAEAEARARAEAEQKAREEAARPIREKLNLLAGQVQSLSIPVDGELAAQVARILDQAALSIRALDVR